MASPAECRADRRGIAGLVIGRRPEDRARISAERDNPGPLAAILPADVGNDPAVFDQRRAGGTEESLPYAEAPHGVDVPESPSRREVKGLQLSLRAKREDPAVDDHGHRARPFIEPEVVTISSRIRGAPLGSSCPRVEGLDDLFIADTVKQNQAIAGHHGSREALADLLPPDRFRSGGGPRARKRRPAVHAISHRPEKLRPVIGGEPHAGHKDGGSQKPKQSPGNWVIG